MEGSEFKLTGGEVFGIASTRILETCRMSAEGRRSYHTGRRMTNRRVYLRHLRKSEK